jgi:cytochrome c2
MKRWLLMVPIVLAALVAMAIYGFSWGAPRVEGATAQTAAPGDALRGAQHFARYGCDSCHMIPGVRTADSPVGPPLHAWSQRRFIAGNLPNTFENTVRWLMHPQEIEPGTAMPDMGVTESDARDMAAYLFRLRNDGWDGE